MNNDLFVLKSIQSLLDEHIEYMQEKYKGSICTDDAGDEYVILSIFKRDGKVIANFQSERYGFMAYDELDRYNITDRKI